MAQAARAVGQWPFGETPITGLTFADGAISGGRQRLEVAPFVAALPPDARAQLGSAAPGEAYLTHSQHAYGAYCVELSVDAATCEVRLRRMVGVFDAGRILNPKLALSQIKGGMLWGTGGALLEGSELDPRHGWFAMSDLANHHVMAHADVPEIDAHFLEGYDPLSNPMGSRGIGELGVCGSGAAVAHAVYDAVGARVRRFPLTVEQVLEALPA